MTSMSNETIRDEIARLEARIEDLSEAAARCRKLILLSKVLIAASGLLLLAILVGLIAFDPMPLIGAIAAILGGIVLFGSNTSTLGQFTAEMQAAEMQRAELIGGIDLQLVPGRATLH
jgi:hypothetical protein